MVTQPIEVKSGSPLSQEITLPKELTLKSGFTIQAQDVKGKEIFDNSESAFETQEKPNFSFSSKFTLWPIFKK